MIFQPCVDLGRQRSEVGMGVPNCDQSEGVSDWSPRANCAVTGWVQSLFRGFWAIGKKTAVTAPPSKSSPELRRRAIAEMIGRDHPIVEAVRDLGIRSAELLENWVDQAGRDAALQINQRTQESAEIKQLHKEVANQHPTIEILKATTTYFSQELEPGLGERCVHRLEPAPPARRRHV